MFIHSCRQTFWCKRMIAVQLLEMLVTTLVTVAGRWDSASLLNGSQLRGVLVESSEALFSGSGGWMTQLPRHVASPREYVMDKLNLSRPSPNTVTSLPLLSFGAALPR